MRFCFIYALFMSYATAPPPPPLSDEYVRVMPPTTWETGRNFPADANFTVVKTLAGANYKDNYFKVIPQVRYKVRELPKEFDVRIRWPNCKTLGEIREQGACASSWAVAAAATMTDRYCIHSNATQNHYVSSEDLHSCCVLGDCMSGGYVSVAWHYWQVFGVTSGGPYGSNEGCKPYTLPPCNFNEGCNVTAKMPVCKHKCKNEHDRSYKKSKLFGQRVYTLPKDELQIRLEIYRNGPVEAVMRVFDDFLWYKSGVYKHEVGYNIGGHAVKLLGWGEEKGIKYWLAANSWGNRFGSDGFFKIMRGVDHCGIEGRVIAGKPAYRNKLLRKNIELNLFNKVSLKLDWKF